MSYSINKELHTKNDYEKYIDKIIKTKTSGELKVLGVHDKIERNKRYVCEFLNTKYQKLVYRGSLIDKKIKDDTLPDLHIGEKYHSNNCGDLIIVEKVKSEIYLCKFIKTNSQVNANIANIIKGEVNDPYAPIVCGVGYLGNIKPKYYNIEYTKWSKLLERIYGDNHKERFPNYIDVKLDDRWLCFENFITDFKTLLGYEDMISHKNIKFDLDKDIKTQSKLYSKETCILVPHEINTIINFIQKTNTTGYPGVSWDKEKGIYQVGFAKMSKRIHLGYANNVFDGFIIFAKAKRAHLNNILHNKYSWLNPEIKQLIIDRLEERLSRYE